MPSDNRTDFIKKIKRRLSKRGDAAYMSISQDCSNTEGMGLSIYTKCLRAIKPEKFFTVDLVYEKFFKTKRDNYLYYKVAFEKVFNCSFGSIYDQQEKVFDRKPFNRTKAIDFLRNLIIRKEKEDGNKQDEK